MLNKRGFRLPVSEQEGGADQMWQASGWWDLVGMEMDSRPNRVGSSG